MEKANDKARWKVEQEIGKLLFDLVKLTYVGLFIGALAAFIFEKKLSVIELIVAMAIAVVFTGILLTLGIVFTRHGYQNEEELKDG